MEQATFAIIVTSIFIFLFISAFYFKNQNATRTAVNENLALATRAIEDCVSTLATSMEELALGYYGNTEPIFRVRIDEVKLLHEFDNVLYKNFNNTKKYNDMQQKIVCRVIVYPDRFVITDQKYNIDLSTGKPKTIYSYSEELRDERNLFYPAQFFTYTAKLNASAPDRLFYINTKNNIASLEEPGFGTGSGSSANIPYWNFSRAALDNGITHEFTNLYGDRYNDREPSSPLIGSNHGMLTTFDRNQAIINRVVEGICQFTGEASGRGLVVKIPNPANTYEKNTQVTSKSFNFFTGITFLVIYREESAVKILDQLVNYNNYNIAGYTLELNTFGDYER